MNEKKSKTGVRVFNQSVILILSLYKRALSPFLPRACRFYPSCSAYAGACFQKFPFFRALGLSAKRLARCHPLCEGGLDPAP